MGYKAVIFDLDGTLLDTLGDIASCMNDVLERLDFPMHELDKYKYFVGDGIKVLVERVIPEDKRTLETIETCLSEYREEYSKRWDEKARPYDGIPELLDELVSRNIKLAILSNKPHQITVSAVEKLLSKWHFEVIYGERTGLPKKPDPHSAFEIIDIIGVKPEEILYLGDTNVDMETANAAGMYPVGVLWGFRDADELNESGAKTLIAHPMELVRLL